MSVDSVDKKISLLDDKLMQITSVVNSLSNEVKVINEKKKNNGIKVSDFDSTHLELFLNEYFLKEDAKKIKRDDLFNLYNKKMLEDKLEAKDRATKKLFDSICNKNCVHFVLYSGMKGVENKKSKTLDKLVINKKKL